MTDSSKPSAPINRRSANITQGKSRAPNRSMYYAMGYEEGDFVKPMVGVANGHSTITPCNSGLQKLADAAIAGIEEAGGNAQVFGTQPEVASMMTPEAPLGLLPSTKEEAEKIVISESPIVANSSRAIDLSRERKRSAQSPYYPEVDLIGQYNYEQDNKGTIGSRRDYVVKVEARWNLFTGFSTRADVADATFRNMAAVDNHSFINR